jgi:hypothetical protein
VSIGAAEDSGLHSGSVNTEARTRGLRPDGEVSCEIASSDEVRLEVLGLYPAELVPGVIVRSLNQTDNIGGLFNEPPALRLLRVWPARVK